MVSTPHDSLFKETFNQPDLARSELELILPPEVRAHLDLATLAVVPGDSLVDPELQQVHTDLLYAVRTKGGGDGFVLVVCEHQSYFDATMPIRLLGYMVRVWTRWLRDHKGTKTLPIVLPVVVHHGEDGTWTAAPEFAAMFDASPELLEATRPFVPHFQFILDDLSALSAVALASRPLAALPRLVQLALWASRSFPRLVDAAPFMRAVLATLVRDERARALLGQFYVYVWSTAPADVDEGAIRSILVEIAGPEGEEDVMNAADQLIQRGRAEGEQTGLERGRAEGLRTATARVLEARGLVLSELGRARLGSCVDVVILTLWLERAATSASEAEVFASAP